MEKSAAVHKSEINPIISTGNGSVFRAYEPLEQGIASGIASRNPSVSCAGNVRGNRLYDENITCPPYKISSSCFNCRLYEPVLRGPERTMIPFSTRDFRAR